MRDCGVKYGSDWLDSQDSQGDSSLVLIYWRVLDTVLDTGTVLFGVCSDIYLKPFLGSSLNDRHLECDWIDLRSRLKT